MKQLKQALCLMAGLWCGIVTADEPGKLLCKKWIGVKQMNLTLVENDHPSHAPDICMKSYISQANFTSNDGEYYAREILGWFHPPTTGNYTFIICADDEARFYLNTTPHDSSEANVTERCRTDALTSYQQTNKYASQTSAAISLTAGQKYFIKANHLQKGNSDHLTIFVEGPGLARQILSGNLISAPTVALYDTHITSTSTTAPTLKLTNTATNTPYLQFQSGGILQDTGSGSLRLRGVGSSSVLTFDTNSTERMRIGANGNIAIGTTDTSNGRLTVTPDGDAMTHLGYTSGSHPYNSDSTALFSNKSIGLVGSSSSLNFPLNPEETDSGKAWWLVGRASGGTDEFGIMMRQGDFNNSRNLYSVFKVKASGSTGQEYIDYLTFHTSQGTERMRIDATGKVKITGDLEVTGSVTGTVSPAGANGQVQFNNNGQLGADAALFWNNTNKHLGLGGAPGQQLHLQSGYPVLLLQETDASADEQKWFIEANSGVFKLRALNDAENAGTDFLQVTRSGSTVGNVIFPTGNVGIGCTPADSQSFGKALDIQSITYGGAVYLRKSTDTTQYGYVGYDYATKRMQLSSYGASGILTFTTGTGADQERMRIDSVGNVAIGRTPTSSRLTVQSADFTDASGSGTLAVWSSDAVAADKGGKIVFGGTYTGTSATGWASVSGRKQNGTDGDYGGYLTFCTRASGSAPAERMRISSSGNVGIGTSSPAFPLDVNGNQVRFSRAGKKLYINPNYGESNTHALLQADTGMALAFATGGDTERMRIDKDGTLKINTTIDPTTGGFQRPPLLVKQFNESTGSGIHIEAHSDDSAGYIGFNASGFAIGASYRVNGSFQPLIFQTSGLERMYVDTSGHVGIGIRPAAWASTLSSLSIGGNCALEATKAQGAGADLSIVNNAFFDGGWKHISTDEASAYRQVHGTHYFRVAPSGVAGTGIAWVDAMMIDNAGNVGIGTTATLTNKLEVNGNTKITGNLEVTGTLNGQAIGTANTAGDNGQIQFNNNGQLGASASLHWDNATKQLGIGTAPGYLLDLRKDSGTWELLRLKNTTASAGALIRFENAATDTNGWDVGVIGSDDFVIRDSSAQRLRIRADGSAAFGTPSFRGRFTVSDTDNSWCGIAAEASNRYAIIEANGDDNAALRFFISNSEKSSHSLAMSISESGNVGIGTTAPSTQLDVVNNQNTTTRIRVGNTDAGTGASAGYQLNNGTCNTYLTLYGTNVASSAYIEADATVLQGTGAGGVNIAASNTSGSIKLFTGGATERVRIASTGTVTIAKTTATEDYELTVSGRVKAEEIVIETEGADFVFEKDYKLPSLADVEKHVTTKKHLPGIASAAEMQKNGMDLSKQVTKHLQKIEELTLYTIRQEKKLEQKDKEVEELKKRLERIEKLLERR